MFTGLVESLAQVVAVREEPPGRRLTLRAGVLIGCQVGDSIALNGCCLTAVAVEGDAATFEAGPETLKRTNLGRLALGSQVNVERSLRFDERLGGHFVTGHVDAAGRVVGRSSEGAWATLWFQAPQELMAQIVPKGSVAVDGVSLTVVECREDQFSVQLIPHTLAVTTLGQRQTGDEVNLETDLLAKYVQKLVRGET